MNAKTDCTGNPVVLVEREIHVFNKKTGQLMSTTHFNDVFSAKRWFNRITCSHRGCGKNVYMKHPQARVYYGQLIISL